MTKRKTKTKPNPVTLASLTQKKNNPKYALRVYKFGDWMLGQTITWAYEIRKINWIPIDPNKPKYAHCLSRFSDAIIETGYATNKEHNKKRIIRAFGGDRLEAYRGGYEDLGLEI